MKNKIVAVMSSMATLALPMLASAAQYSSSTAATDFSNAMSDVGTMVAAGVAAALAGLVALTGLGFGWRHFRKYVSGRKF